MADTNVRTRMTTDLMDQGPSQDVGIRVAVVDMGGPPRGINLGDIVVAIMTGTRVPPGSLMRFGSDM